MQNEAHILTLVKELMTKIVNLKLMIFLEYQNIKTFLQKAMFQIGLKKFLRLKKLQTLCRGYLQKRQILLINLNMLPKIKMN